MECAICMERTCDYSLSGCSHSICSECAEQMEPHADEYLPFGENIQINLRVPLLNCPFCRAPEVITKKYRDELNHHYPEAYHLWFQTELFRDHDGSMYYTSLRKNNIRFLPKEDDDIYSLLERFEYSSRTTSCYVGYHNLYTDPDYFIIWFPFHHQYPVENKLICSPRGRQAKWSAVCV